MKMRLPLPTTIVTGALGVGKTTAIAALLARRPAGEKWAVLVNEFGALGVDGALLEAIGSEKGDPSVPDGITIKQLAGGCMCCAAAGMLTPALAMLIRQAKPDRLVIEPSGLGHPAGLIDILQGEHLKTAIQLQAVICLVDPGRMEQLKGLYLDQVNIADIVIASKADLASQAVLDNFLSWAESLYPPKMAVHTMAKGGLDFNLLNADASHKSPPLQLHEPHVHGAHSRWVELGRGSAPTAGQPSRVVASGDGGSAAGWVFSAEDTFQEQALLEFLQALWGNIQRVKGVFRTGTKRWVTPTLSLTERGSERVAFTEVAYRKDSRIEIIVGDARDAGCQMQPDTRHHNPYHGACGREDSGSSGNSLLAAEAAGSALLELSLSVHDITAAARSTAWDDVERQLLRLLKVAAA